MLKKITNYFFHSDDTNQTGNGMGLQNEIKKASLHAIDVERMSMGTDVRQDSTQMLIEKSQVAEQQFYSNNSYPIFSTADSHYLGMLVFLPGAFVVFIIFIFFVCVFVFNIKRRKSHKLGDKEYGKQNIINVQASEPVIAKEYKQVFDILFVQVFSFSCSQEAFSYNELILGTHLTTDDMEWTDINIEDNDDNEDDDDDDASSKDTEDCSSSVTIISSDSGLVEDKCEYCNACVSV